MVLFVCFFFLDSFLAIAELKLEIELSMRTFAEGIGNGELDDKELSHGFGELEAQRVFEVGLKEGKVMLGSIEPFVAELVCIRVCGVFAGGVETEVIPISRKETLRCRR